MILSKPSTYWYILIISPAKENTNRVMKADTCTARAILTQSQCTLLGWVELKWSDNMTIIKVNHRLDGQLHVGHPHPTEERTTTTATSNTLTAPPLEWLLLLDASVGISFSLNYSYLFKLTLYCWQPSDLSLKKLFGHLWPKKAAVICSSF